MPLGAAGPVRPMMTPVPDSVEAVFALGTILQVTDVIVKGVAIEVSCYHSIREWPNESFEDKAMDALFLLSTLLR